MTSLGDIWRDFTGKPEGGVPSHTVIPRLRESSGLLPAIRPGPVTAGIAPDQPVQALPPPTLKPPAWSDVFPVHYKALETDMQHRGEDMVHWEVQDGRDMGVSEDGHTVAFRLHKTGTSATILVELTMCRGKLGRVRVR